MKTVEELKKELKSIKSQIATKKVKLEKTLQGLDIATKKAEANPNAYTNAGRAAANSDATNLKAEIYLLEDKAKSIQTRLDLAKESTPAQMGEE